MQLKMTDLWNERHTNQERKKKQILNPQRHSTIFLNPDTIRNFLHLGPDLKKNLFYEHLPSCPIISKVQS